MTKMVIRNYIAAFKWKNIKEYYRDGLWFAILYFTVIMPMLIGMYNTRDVRYFCYILPVAYALVTSVIFPMRMPKIMYMCPLSRELRKEYITKMRIIRTVVPIGMTLVISTIPLMIGQSNAVVTIGVILNNTIFSIFIGSGVNTNGYGQIDEKGQREITCDNLFSVLEFVCFFCTVIMCYIYSEIDANSDSLKLTLLIIGINLLILLPITISYLRYWPSAVENALSYETRLNKPTKIKR